MKMFYITELTAFITTLLDNNPMLKANLFNWKNITVSISDNNKTDKDISDIKAIYIKYRKGFYAITDIYVKSSYLVADSNIKIEIDLKNEDCKVSIVALDNSGPSLGMTYYACDLQEALNKDNIFADLIKSVKNYKFNSEYENE